MKTRVLAIVDADMDYANSLMEYISDKQGVPFRTIVFTEKEALLEYVSKNKTDILLASASFIDDRICEEENIKNIIQLSTDNVCPEHTEYHSIYKYQSTENVIREVLDYYADVHSNDGIMPILKGKSEIIGVYSPLGRTGQTTFALTLGQILASEYSVLYINMEEFSAFDKIFQKNYHGDLSDLMYFFKQNRESLSIKLQAIVNSMHGMDYVPPLVYSSDLRNISTEEWLDLIMSVSGTGNYDKIILDLSSMVSDVFDILDVCSQVYMPVSDDRISMLKIASCEEYLMKSGREELADRIIKIKHPQFEGERWDENFWERQLWGKLGDFIRKMLREAA